MISEKMSDDILKVFFNKEQIAARVKELGAQITKDYKGKDLFLLGVLKGCYVFMSDLSRCIDLPLTMDFMAVSSYGDGTSTTGAVKITKDLRKDIEGKDVLIVEDILDSGVTLSYLTKYLQGRNPASIKIVTLLDKKARRQTDITPDYFGFDVADEFVVGYGLDYAEYYRNLPYIGILKPKVYSD